MIKEAYCSLEISKLLKEKGFDELCVWKYKDGVRIKAGNAIDEYQNSELDDDECSAPTHQMAMRWLREEKYIFISLHPSEECIYGIIFKHSRTKPSMTICGKRNHEEAVEASLKYVLQKLI